MKDDEVRIRVRDRGVRRFRANRRLVLDSVVLRDQDFSGRRLDDFVAIACAFTGCRFENMRLKQACFGGGVLPSDYTECTFDGSRLSSIAPGRARFVRCSFERVVFEDLICRTVEMIDCVFSGTLKRGLFLGAVPEDQRSGLGRAENAFHGNDFSRMALGDVGFRAGIDLARQRLPSGPDYVHLTDAGPALRDLRREVVGWTDLDARKKALVVLKTLEQELEGGQRGLFLNRRIFPRSHRGMAERLLDRLQWRAAP